MDLLTNSEITFNQQHLLRLSDYSKEEILTVLSLALKLKKARRQGIPHAFLTGKTLAMIFTKSSTRTRVSFEAGVYQMGGMGMFLSANDIQLGRGEPISDTAKVLSRMVDGIMIRTFAQSDVEDLAKYGSIPVINGLTDLFHPCQALADILTLYEAKGRLEGLKLCYLGDGNNVAHSLIVICAKLGIAISVGCPDRYRPNEQIVSEAKSYAAATIEITSDAHKALADADAVYTDVWTSMGQDTQTDGKVQTFMPYQVNKQSFAEANPDAIFLHCLPAHRGEEVTADVIDGAASRVFDEAENRLHVQKAVMTLLMGNREEVQKWQKTL